VVINEVYPNTNGWIELYNKGNKNEDISGWYFVWSGGTYTIPQNTKIQKNSFLAFDIGDIPATDTITLYDYTAAQQDSTSFTSIPLTYGWGRYPDGSGTWWVTIPTRASANIIPEFSDAIAPLMFTIFIFGLVRYRKNKVLKKKKGKGNNMKKEDSKISSFVSNDMENLFYERITRELVLISDVDEAGIIKEDGSIISWHPHQDIKPNPLIDFTLDFISKNNLTCSQELKMGMFTQAVMDFNGHKMLISKIKPDIILMLLLKKRAYLGLTMLDLEGCLREINKAMNKNRV